MQFAIVESKDRVLEPVVLLGTKGKSLIGRHLTGDIVSFDLAKVVHAGMTGEEPNTVYQFCPTWLAVSARAAGLGKTRAAANPGKIVDPGAVRYQSGELVWNHESRKDRRKEQELFRALSKETGGAWSGYEIGHEFGYDQIKQFIRQHREQQSPDTFLWCMIFAALTANEGTQDAERNLLGFSTYLRSLFESGAIPRAGMLSFDQFVSAWRSGLQKRKFADFNALLTGYERLVPALAQAKRMGLRGRELRRFIATTPNVGFPAGLGVTKFSFAMECWGENVACLDRWMFRSLGADEKVGKSYIAPGRGKGPIANLDDANRKIAAHKKHGDAEERAEKLVPKPPWAPFTEGSYVLSEYGGGRFSKRRIVEEGETRPEMLAKHGLTPTPVVDEYEWWEDKLKKTVYYSLALKEAKTDPRAADNPLARAQWTMWEDIMRRHPDQTIQLDKARHMPLWLAIHGNEAVIRRALISYHEHREEGTRRERQLQERTIVGTAPKKRKEIARAALPAATAAHELAIRDLKIAKADTVAEVGPKFKLLPKRRRNPSNLGRVFSEALAWKRGEVSRASAQARELAGRLSAKALAEFARMA